jgi:hypothetical protein
MSWLKLIYVLLIVKARLYFSRASLPHLPWIVGIYYMRLYYINPDLISNFKREFGGKSK